MEDTEVIAAVEDTSCLTQRAPDGASAPRFGARLAGFCAIISLSLRQSAPPVTQTVSPLIMF